MSKQNDESDWRRALLIVSDGVLGAAVMLAVGVYAGSWLDTKFHTSPWLSVGLSILGGALGLARMVMKAKALDTGPDLAKSSRPQSASQDKDYDGED